MRAFCAADLTTADVHALRVLIGCKVPVRCGHFGDLVWPDHYHGSACSAPFARPAGKVLRRLERAKLATYHDGWSATHTARTLLTNDPGKHVVTREELERVRRVVAEHLAR